MHDKLISIYDIASSIRKTLTNNDEVKLNIKQLVKELNGKIKYEEIEYHDTYGIINKLKSKYNFEFIINKNIKKNNDLFYVAHLIGHLVLHSGYLINSKLWQDIDKYIDSVYYRNGFSSEESEANHFATALMISNKDFIDYINKHKVNNEINLKEMANFCKVPIIFLNWYGVYLRHFPCIISDLH